MSSPPIPTVTPGLAHADLERRTIRVLRMRIVWLLFVVFLLNALDRTGVSFAALQMNDDLGLTPSVYGFGAGLTLLGLLIFQVPSVALLKRMNWRLWLGIIVVCWGAATAAMSTMNSPTEFAVYRFLLGVFEAGFSPGMVYIVAQWIPERHRGAAMGSIIMAVPVSLLLGGPISGWLLENADLVGMAGWRFLFLATGLATIVVGIMSYFWTDVGPAQARWLDAEQRSWLVEQLELKDSESSRSAGGVRGALSSRAVWTTALIWCSLTAGMFGLVFWLPQIVKNLDPTQSNMRVALLSSLPWMASAAAMFVNGRLSDRTGRRRLHTGAGAAIAVVGLLVGWTSTDPLFGMIGLVLAGLGVGAAHGVFWTLPLSYLPAKASATGILIVNLSGTLSGLLITNLVGIVREATGSFEPVGYLLAGMVTAGILLLFTLPEPRPFSPGASALH